MIIRNLLELIDVNLIVPMDVHVVDYPERLDRTQLKGVGRARFACMLNCGDCLRRSGCVCVPKSATTSSTWTRSSSLDVATEVMKREAYNFFGTVFTNHLQMARILMREDREGHRSFHDSGSGRTSVQFKVSRGPR